uniref:BRO1 domain-containing protein n=1 Tax=Gongylonema pulchrum TaxID=637853 RepID=A0A183ESU1_9BILA
LNKMRNRACNQPLDKHQSALDVITRYYDQLVAIENKVPMTATQNPISFKWKDAFDKGSLFFGRASLSTSSSTDLASALNFVPHLPTHAGWARIPQAFLRSYSLPPSSHACRSQAVFIVFLPCSARAMQPAAKKCNDPVCVCVFVYVYVHLHRYFYSATKQAMIPNFCQCVAWVDATPGT